MIIKQAIQQERGSTFHGSSVEYAPIQMPGQTPADHS